MRKNVAECKNIPRKHRNKKNLEREASRNGRGGRGEGEGESPAAAATKQGESDEETSPRGVLEMLVSGIDEKSRELSNLQGKKMFGQVKKSSSVWKISTISLLGGANGLSKKALRKKMGRRSNSEDAGDFVMPKPSWRNFSYEELRQATDGFTSGKS